MVVQIDSRAAFCSLVLTCCIILNELALISITTPKTGSQTSFVLEKLHKIHRQWRDWMVNKVQGANFCPWGP